jgi:hypothetical protein
METNNFINDFPTLSTELHEFQYNADKSDEYVARRLIVNRNKNPHKVLIATARALVEESSLVLKHFDLRWEEFVEVSNLVALQKKRHAKIWLEKLNKLWAKTLRDLESNENG